MLRISAALFLLCPAIASAQCLTADALDTGITIEYGSGNTSHIQRTADGTIMDAFSENSRYTKRTLHFETVAGVFEKSRIAHNDRGWEIRYSIIMEYDFDTEQAATYTPGEGGYGRRTIINQLVSREIPETLSWASYESEPLVVGDCSYEAVRVFTFEWILPEGSIYIREIKYLPELGFGIQLENSFYGLPANNHIITSMNAS